MWRGRKDPALEDYAYDIEAFVEKLVPEKRHESAPLSVFGSEASRERSFQEPAIAGEATLTILPQDELVSLQPQQEASRPDRIILPPGKRKEQYEETLEQLLNHRITGELRRLIAEAKTQDPTIDALELLAVPYTPNRIWLFDAIARQAIELMQEIPHIVSLPGINYAQLKPQHVEHWQTSYAGRSLMYELWHHIEFPEQ